MWIHVCLWDNGCKSRFLTFQINTFHQFVTWCIVWTSYRSLIFYFIHIFNELRKETYKNKIFFDLLSFLSVLTVLTVVIELCWYPGCLFAVPPDNVEVRKQVQGNLHKELKAKEGQDTKVDVGQLGRKRLVGQIPRWLRHFYRGVWVIMKTGLDAPSNNRRVVLVFSQRTDELARPDKVQLREKMLCSCQSFPATSAMLHTCVCL